MAFTLVTGQIFSQVSNHWAASASAAAKSLPNAAAAGNIVVVVASIGDANEDVLSIDDNGTTVYARAHRQSDATTGNVLETWYGIAAGAGAGQGVVVTKEGATDNGEDAIVIFEFAGNDLTQATLQTNGAATASTTTHDSGSVTPGTAANLLIAVSRGSDREWSVDADFTTVIDNARTTVAYKIQAANTAQSYTVTSDVGGFAVLSIVAFKGATAGGAYTVTADQGSYALTGQDVALNRGRTLTAEQGTYSLIGSVGLVDLSMVAAQGSYTLTGQAVNLLHAFRITAAQGAYALTGQSAILLYSGAPTASPNPRWFPLPLGKELNWLRRYAGLQAAAIAEANAAGDWAKFKLYGNIAIDVHSVPGYPRPNYTN